MGQTRDVDVIVLCSASGELRPLRLRLTEGRESVRLDIDRVLQVTEVFHTGAERKIFRCRASSGEREWTIELSYLLRSQTWQLLA